MINIALSVINIGTDGCTFVDIAPTWLCLYGCDVITSSTGVCDVMTQCSAAQPIFFMSLDLIFVLKIRPPFGDFVEI